MISLERVYRTDRMRLLKQIRRSCITWDATQDALHEAIAKLLSLGKECHPQLLYVTAVNVELDRQRIERNHTRLNPIASTWWADHEISAEDCVREKQLSDLYDQALGYLVINEDKLAEAFLLRTQLELRWDEIGRSMKVSPRMAQIYVERAVECLREYVHA